jgi:hypothetical protein
MSRWLEKKLNQNKLYYLINNQLNIKWWNWKIKQEFLKNPIAMDKKEKKKTQSLGLRRLKAPGLLEKDPGTRA